MNEMMYATEPNGHVYHLIPGRAAYALCGTLIKPGIARTRLEIPVPIPVHGEARRLCKLCNEKFQESQTNLGVIR